MGLKATHASLGARGWSEFSCAAAVKPDVCTDAVWYFGSSSLCCKAWFLEDWWLGKRDGPAVWWGRDPPWRCPVLESSARHSLKESNQCYTDHFFLSAIFRKELSSLRLSVKQTQMNTSGCRSCALRQRLTPGYACTQPKHGTDKWTSARHSQPAPDCWRRSHWTSPCSAGSRCCCCWRSVWKSLPHTSSQYT